MKISRTLFHAKLGNSGKSSGPNIHKSLEIIAWSALGIFFLAPLFLITYYQDDRIFVLLSEFSSLHPFDSAIIEIEGWLKNGRFLPISIFVRYMFFDFFSYNNPELYHFSILFFSGAAFFTFLKLIKIYEFKGSSLLFFLFFMALTQFRVTAPDPVVGYNALLQINTIIVCGSLIFIELYFQSSKIRYFIIGALLAIVSILYYEISVAILATPIVVNLYKYRFKVFYKQFLLYSLFYISMLVIFIALRMYLKQSYAVAGLDLYPGTEMGFDFKSVLFSFFFQVSGSLPLSYIAHLFERVFHTYLITFTIISLACIFIYFKRAQIVLLDKKIVIFSMFIIFSAALPVALSQHHSSWVSFGYPYIPVFIQNLALAAILAALVSNTIAVRGLLFMIIFVSSIPNYVLFHELNKKDGPVRLVFDLFRLQDYKIKPQFDKTFIVDGSEFGMDVKFVQSKARAELGEIYFTNIGKAVYKKGAVSNTIILSKSSYKNTIAVMGEIDKGNEIKNPTYISPNRACVEKISLDKDKIISYKTHRDTVIFTYSDPGYYRSENKLSCNFNYSLYDRLMDKFIPKY